MDINFLVKLTSRGWSLPILAALVSGVAGRQAALVAATGAGRVALGQSLDHLIGLGLVARNTGHGHPLRPEFRLTPRGQAAAAFAQDILRLTPGPEQALIRRNWTLPVLGQLQTPSPFSAIKQGLPITDRALSLSLQRLESHAWIARRVTEGRPPRPMYQAAGLGKDLVARLAPVTRA